MANAGLRYRGRKFTLTVWGMLIATAIGATIVAVSLVRMELPDAGAIIAYGGLVTGILSSFSFANALQKKQNGGP